jgi:hypothetical protein
VYVAPTTAAPVYVAPTTAAPVYVAPTTAAPVYVAPTKAAPAYVSPAYKASSYVVPSTVEVKTPGKKYGSVRAPGYNLGYAKTETSEPATVEVKTTYKTVENEQPKYVPAQPNKSIESPIQSYQPYVSPTAPYSAFYSAAPSYVASAYGSVESKSTGRKYGSVRATGFNLGYAKTETSVPSAVEIKSTYKVDQPKYVTQERKYVSVPAVPYKPAEASKYQKVYVAPVPAAPTYVASYTPVLVKSPGKKFGSVRAVGYNLGYAKTETSTN